jgi:hypothetical protein
LLKYLGYDVKPSAGVIKEIEYDKKSDNNESSNNSSSLDLIPPNILEIVEGFAVRSNIKKHPLECSRFCPRPPYYFYSLLSLLIHLNDYHKMTFMEIGNWLERKGM